MTAKKKIGIIGAGFSGICAAVNLQKEFGDDVSYDIFDENEDFGGTWLVNKYPGCACDVQSHLYSLSFEPNPNWTSNYPTQPEIWDYIVRIAKKYDLYRHAKFNTEVKSGAWSEEDAHWKVLFRNKITGIEEQRNYDYIISCVGGLRVPLIPEVFKDFTGPVMHSAEWNDRINLKGKRVAVIGSGASAIQIIPQIASQVKELHSYQRHPAWVVPQMQFKIPELLKQIFAYLPFLMMFWRLYIFLSHEITHFAFYADSFLMKIGMAGIRFRIRREVKDKNMAEKLIPNYVMGCKRIMVHGTYYKTFNRPNVHLHRDPIISTKNNTITTSNGNTKDAQKYDVLILATGFRVQDFFAPVQIKGRNDLDILAYWIEHGPQHYKGIVSSQMPNGFSLLGPNTGQGHNTAIYSIECQTEFAMKVLRHCLDTKVKIFTVKREVEEKFLTWIHREISKMVWGAAKCGSWYVCEDGLATTIWPKTLLAYRKATKNIDFSEFDFIR